jgi:hypothetical protein
MREARENASWDSHRLSQHYLVRGSSRNDIEFILGFICGHMWAHICSAAGIFKKPTYCAKICNEFFKSYSCAALLLIILDGYCAMFSLCAAMCKLKLGYHIICIFRSFCLTLLMILFNFLLYFSRSVKL